MSTSLFDPSARTAERHIANNQNKTIAPSAMRFCYGPRCRGGSVMARAAAAVLASLDPSNNSRINVANLFMNFAVIAEVLNDHC